MIATQTRVLLGHRTGAQMFIYNCTSTLYHPPVMTVILIVFNVLVFGVTASADPNTVSDYCLWYGSGYHPVQWVTSGFMHANFGHLLGNMLFLWPFGLLVEGKLGWWKFLILYLVIAIGQNALEQTIMLGASSTVDASQYMDSLADNPDFAEMSLDEREFLQTMLQESLANEVRRSLGASAVIFGLLAVCILFAPVSDFHVWWRFGSFDAPVLLVGAFYVLLEFYQWHVGGLGISSAALHLLGLVSGAVVGIAFLRMGIPQCDNEDLFSHLFSKSIAKESLSSSSTKSRAPKLSPLERAKQNADAKRKRKATDSKSAPPSTTSRSPSPTHLEHTNTQTTASRDAKQVDEIRNASLAKPILASIQRRNVMAAAEQLHAQSSTDVLRTIPSEQYSLLFREASRNKQWPASVVALQKWLQAHPNAPDQRQLQLAQIWLLGLRQTDKANEALGKVTRSNLDDKQTELFKKLVIKIHHSN